MELVYIEAPQVPVYKHLHITSYFCKMVAQSRDSETQELILKQLKHTFINNKKIHSIFRLWTWQTQALVKDSSCYKEACRSKPHIMLCKEKKSYIK